MEEMLEIDGFDEALVTELQMRASAILLTQEIATQSALNDAVPADDLLQLDGMSELMAKALASQGVVTLDDLAELAVDELMELVELENEQEAGELIIKRSSLV